MILRQQRVTAGRVTNTDEQGVVNTHAVIVRRDGWEVVA